MFFEKYPVPVKDVPEETKGIVREINWQIFIRLCHFEHRSEPSLTNVSQTHFP